MMSWVALARTAQVLSRIHSYSQDMEAACWGHPVQRQTETEAGQAAPLSHCRAPVFIRKVEQPSVRRHWSGEVV